MPGGNQIESPALTCNDNGVNVWYWNEPEIAVRCGAAQFASGQASRGGIISVGLTVARVGKRAD